MFLLYFKKDIKRFILKLGISSRGFLGYGSLDFDVLMYLVGYCNFILVVVVLLLK